MRPTALVIFGASGDLTKRKLLPAVYNLALSRLLPGGFAVVGVARRPLPEFAEDMKHHVAKFSRRKPLDETTWTELSHGHLLRAGGASRRTRRPSTSLKAELDRLDGSAAPSRTASFTCRWGPTT